MEKLKSNLRKFRKEKKLTQKELAVLVGVSGNYIQKLETGVKDNPTISLAKKISEELDITLEELIN